MDKKPLVEIEKISKKFPGVQALDQVSVSFFPGEVHAIIGENGAGKSTLIKIIGGVYQKDGGKIKIKGKECLFSDVNQAKKSGISVIHQELSLIPDLSVAENLCLGREPRLGNSGFINKRAMRKMAKRILGTMGLKIDLDVIIRNLSTADRQMIEIARAVSQKAMFVIMDEPTTSLSSREIGTLFKIIKKLKNNGVCVIYVSHILSEVLEIADRITVLKDGCFVRTLSASEAKENLLVKLMVGREIKDYFSRKEKTIGGIVLEVRNLTRDPYFSDISFILRKGEILGISGLVGSGRTELIRSIFAADQFDKGEIILINKKVAFKSPEEAIKNGFGFVPEDRRLQGLILEASVKYNISLPSISATAKFGFVNTTWEQKICEKYVKKLKIRIPTFNSLTRSISGGNQQKIVVAKWLAATSKIMLLNEPTRGIDVNSKSELYSLMNSFTKEGGSIIMVSSELPEILGVADRILVIREGKLTANIDRKDATEEKIMMLASTSKNNGYEVKQ